MILIDFNLILTLNFLHGTFLRFLKIPPLLWPLRAATASIPRKKASEKFWYNLIDAVFHADYESDLGLPNCVTPTRK